MDTWLNADPHNVVVLHNKVRAVAWVCVCECLNVSLDDRVYLPISLDFVSI